MCPAKRDYGRIEEEEEEDDEEDTASAGEQDVDTATTGLFEDQFQKQLLDYRETVACHGELALAVEDEQIYRVNENGKEIIYWKQLNRSSQPIVLTEEAPTLDGWTSNREVKEAYPQTRFEMLYGDEQAAVFTASREQFNPPLGLPYPLPRTVELAQIHRCLLDENLESAQLSSVCNTAFKSIESNYLQSLQGFATAVQL